MTSNVDGSIGNGVSTFREVNERLWGLPTSAAGEVDWDGAVRKMKAAPEEQCSVLGSYFLSWLSPYIDLAWEERLEEAALPPPQRRHRAVICGARLSHAFREEELRSRRDGWKARVEAAAVTADGTVRVVTVNPLSSVRFHDEEGVVGRLRWLGYLRSCDTPHTLLGGVEWEGCLPGYRRQLDVEGAVHEGIVHGERLFHQTHVGTARCTCEYVADLVPVPTASGGESGQTVPGSPPSRVPPRAPSLLRALFRTFIADVLAMLPPALVGVLCQVATPWLLQQFVFFLRSNKQEEGMTKGLAMFVLFCVVMLAQPLATNKRNHRGRRVSSLFRAATYSLLFEKCLTVCPDALARPDMSSGRILTMASSDVENIRDFPRMMLFLWISPALLAMYLTYLFTLVGWCVLAGVIVFFTSLPIQAAITKSVADRQETLASCTDQRLKHTNELLSGVRVVKAMGWEAKFLSAIEDDARAEELRSRRRVQVCDAWMTLVVWSTPAAMIASILATYTLTGHTLDAAVVLPVIVVVNAVNYPIMMLPMAFTALAKFIVSTSRITQLLECDDANRNLTASAGTASNEALRLDGVTVRTAIPIPLPRYEPRHGSVHRLWNRVVSAALRRPMPVELQWCRAVDVSPLPAMSAVAPTVNAEESSEASPVSASYALEDKILLHNVCVTFPKGGLTIMVGATGSGKSVLLQSLLGAFRTSGKMAVGKSIAYVPQLSWIMQETVRANITFFEGGQRHSGSGEGELSEGEPRSWLAASPLRSSGTRSSNERVIEPPRRITGADDQLMAAVRCCQLEADLMEMPGGVETEIGEKGINLSGGQKARVSLARAVYSDRDVYLLDDPLSALDAHIGRRVMDEVVLGVLAGKTRVLVTHQLQVLPHADQIVVVREGGVVFAGSYADYAVSELRMYTEEAEKEAAAQHEATTVGATVIDEAANASVDKLVEERTRVSAVRETHATSVEATLDLTTKVADAAAAATDEHDGAEGLMTEEEKESGHMPWSVYRRYFEAGGGAAIAARIATQYFIGDGINTCANVWLTLWSVQYFGDRLGTGQQLGVYLLLLMVSRVIVPANDVYFYSFTRRAGRRLHAVLLYTVSSATITFFDRTPLGRIINRFSKDIYVLDEELPSEIIMLTGIVDAGICAMLVVVFTSPPALVVVVVACLCFQRLLRFYTTVVREVRRRGSVVQSPLFSLLEEVMQGRTTLMAYDTAHVLFQEAIDRLDRVYSCTYVEKAVELWLSIRLEYVAAVMIIMVGVIGVLEKALDASPLLSETRVGLISLSLTLSLDLTWSLSETVEHAAAVEACMNSVQRIGHYMDQVPQEALLLEPKDAYVAAVLAAHSNSAGVLSTSQDAQVQSSRNRAMLGSLELSHVDLRYRPGLPLVLRDVCFIISPGEKVGVVGRTGSGKSTLLLTFLRLVEVCGGTMRVCGRDAQSYTLPALRRLFSMIPQDPVLFDGTVRSNVDPFSEVTDAEVMRALAAVGFTDSTSSSNTAVVPALDTMVQEGGSNFSVGQRQLLCLARALLKKGSAFILMDEATANIDAVLDQIVQRVVRTELRDRIVITIAHRLQTVAAYDKILVMAQGQLVEAGTPRELLESRTSVLYDMVAQSGSLSSVIGGDVQSPVSPVEMLSASERQRRAEAAVTAFLRQCK